MSKISTYLSPKRGKSAGKGGSGGAVPGGPGYPSRAPECGSKSWPPPTSRASRPSAGKRARRPSGATVTWLAQRRPAARSARPPRRARGARRAVAARAAPAASSGGAPGRSRRRARERVRQPPGQTLTGFLRRSQPALTPLRLNGVMPSSSRVEAGRRRAPAAGQAVALTAAGGFVVVLGAARHAHPGTAATQKAQLPSTGVSSDARQGLTLGDGAITSPPTVAPSSSGSSSSS